MTTVDDDMSRVDRRGQGVDPAPASWSRGDYLVSTDRGKLDLGAIQRFLIEEASWGAGLTPAMIATAIENSVPFGLYDRAGELAGFARVVTDGAMFAYLRDVFVLSPHRGRGLARWLVECVCGHAPLKPVRTWLLATGDAHGLYERCGFRRSPDPGRYMERRVSGGAEDCR